MKKKGFTLVEMLTSIGIVGLLTAMLIPSLMRAKTIAKTTYCQTNQNAMHKNLNMWAYEWFPDGTPRDGEWDVELAKKRRDSYTGPKDTDDFLGDGFYRAGLTNCPDVKEEMVTTPVNSSSDRNDGGIEKVWLETYNVNVGPLLDMGRSSCGDFVLRGKGLEETTREYSIPKYKMRHYDGFSKRLGSLRFRTNMLHQGYGERPGVNYTYADGHTEFVTWDELNSDKKNVDIPSPD